MFTSQVVVNGNILAVGIGKTKKLAEMQAAKKALEQGL
jgi:dsRNA-specific ribonuclease